MPLSHEAFNEQVASFANDVEAALSALQQGGTLVTTSAATPAALKDRPTQPVGWRRLALAVLVGCWRAELHR